LLRVTLLGELPKAQRTDPEAYSLFLKSKVPARRFTKEGFEEASRLLIQALAIDPEYAQGWSELARNQVNQAMWKKVKLEEGYPRAQVSAQRALSLDPNNALAMAMLGAVEMSWNWDFVAAGEWFRKAREVAPGDATPLTGLAYLTSYFGRADAALELYQEAVDRDPLNVVALGNLASANSSAGRFDIARSQIEAGKQVNPESAYITGRAGWIEWDQGNFEEALLHSYQRERPYELLRACALHGLGRFSEAQAELDGLQQLDTPHAHIVALVYGCWGDKDRAFEWLERAYDEHDPSLLRLRSELDFQKLHDDPRWEALLQKLGLSDEHAEKLGL
jgi:tetratricopeptide (TPR) repeat protein